MRLSTLLSFWTLCIASLGSEVLLVHSEKPFIVISQEKEDPIGLRDRICVVRDGTDIACGDVTVSDPKFAVAKIDFKHEEIKKHSEKLERESWVELEFQRPTPMKGDKIRIEQKDPKKLIRSLTSELVENNSFAGKTISMDRQGEIDLALKKLEDSIPFKPISIIAAGMNFVNPHLQYQQAMSPKWGLGMMAMYINQSVGGGTGSIDGPGFFFTYNRYYKGALNGFWWQLSPGGFLMTAKNGTQIAAGVYQPVLLATVGWRYFWKEKMNFGFGAGSFYFPLGSNAGGTGLEFNGIVPSITLDAGIAF